MSIGHIIFGYSLKDGEIVIDEKNGVIVRKVFEKYLSGYSYTQMANWLNTLKNSTKWEKAKVGRILQNEKYYGIDTKYPAIIEKELFERVQTERNKNNGYLMATPEIEAIRKKSICFECGSKYRRDRIHRINKWACSNKKCKILVKLHDEEVVEKIINIMDKVKNKSDLLNNWNLKEMKNNSDICKIKNALDLEFEKKEIQAESIILLMKQLIQKEYQNCDSYSMEDCLIPHLMDR